MYQGLTESSESDQPILSISIEHQSTEESVRFAIPEGASPLRFGSEWIVAPSSAVATKIISREGGKTSEELSVYFFTEFGGSRSLLYSTGQGRAFGIPYDELPEDLKRMVAMALAGEERSQAPRLFDAEDAYVKLPTLEVSDLAEDAFYRNAQIRRGNPSGEHRNRFLIYSSSGEFIAAPLMRVEGLGDEYLAVSGLYSSVFDALIEHGLATDAGHRWQQRRVIEAQGELRKLTGFGFSDIDFDGEEEDEYDVDMIFTGDGDEIFRA